ncbi:trace amine-associated receptor 1-like [Notolabrus celidotus]|uniref:trace amine-associated receptor 1-like n=1 Tax=Notolabrus celidotus TaxID=1203425 RepID=UPI00148F9DC6|nr:trace amine-associated receptor 1-like [Notolabrus celidotus]
MSTTRTCRCSLDGEPSGTITTTTTEEADDESSDQSTQQSMEPVCCYESSNTSCPRTIYPIHLRGALYIIFGIIIVLTVCGNLLVTFSVAYFKQLHTPTNYLIVSLAVSDLLVGLLVMFPSMIRTIESCWYFGDFFYKVHMSSNVTLCTASILNLLSISVDRYYAVCQPLLYRSRISVNVVLIMILLTWSVSVFLGFGMTFLKLNIWGVYSGPSGVLSSLLAFYMPGVIMLAVYLKVLLVAQKQFRSIQRAGCVSSVKTSSQTKATKTLAVVMGAFLSFWTPFFVCYVIDPFTGYSTPPQLFEVLMWLGYLNSTVNPVIYAFFYRWFRKAFQLLTSGDIFKSDMSETTLFTE